MTLIIAANSPADPVPIAANVTNSSLSRSAYLHIPFCCRRCYYCDFPISVVGDRSWGNDSRAIDNYVEQLCQEIKIASASGYSLETVFFGGGTPSLLSVEQLERILQVLDDRFGICARAEISMEMDPGTFDRQKLQGYRSLGINRISLGVQAFQDELLKICGRSHSVRDIITAVDLIGQVGVPQFSLDLISGLPHQSLKQWQESLEKAIAIAPHHISTYDLVIESVTAFGRQYKPGIKPLPTEETTVLMYRLARQLLTDAGYEHYEISNYAQPNYQCRHNRVYWENRSYYGWGMGAASYINGVRFTRPRTRQEYYQWIASGCLIENPPISHSDRLLETLMLGLRLAEGLTVEYLKHQFGKATLEKVGTCLQPYRLQGLVETISQDGKLICDRKYFPESGRVRLSDPEGFLVSNTILADLFSQFD